MAIAQCKCLFWRIFPSYTVCLSCKKRFTKEKQTYVGFTGCAAESWWAVAHEHVESIQTGGAVSTGVRLTLINLCLTPATKKQSSRPLLKRACKRQLTANIDELIQSVRFTSATCMAANCNTVFHIEYLHNSSPSHFCRPFFPNLFWHRAEQTTEVTSRK